MDVFFVSYYTGGFIAVEWIITTCYSDYDKMNQYMYMYNWLFDNMIVDKHLVFNEVMLWFENKDG